MRRRSSQVLSRDYIRGSVCPTAKLALGSAGQGFGDDTTMATMLDRLLQPPGQASTATAILLVDALLPVAAVTFGQHHSPVIPTTRKHKKLLTPPRR